MESTVTSILELGFSRLCESDYRVTSNLNVKRLLLTTTLAKVYGKTVNTQK